MSLHDFHETPKLWCRPYAHKRVRWGFFPPRNRSKVISPTPDPACGQGVDSLGRGCGYRSATSGRLYVSSMWGNTADVFSSHNIGEPCTHGTTTYWGIFLDSSLTLAPPFCHVQKSRTGTGKKVAWRCREGWGVCRVLVRFLNNYKLVGMRWGPRGSGLSRGPRASLRTREGFEKWKTEQQSSRQGRWMTCPIRRFAGNRGQS